MQQNHIFLNALESLPFGLVLIAGDGKIAYANHWANQKLRGNAEDRSGVQIGDFLPSAKHLVMGCLTSGQPCTKPHFTYNGSEFRFEITPLFDHGAVDGAVCCLIPQNNASSPSDEFFQSLYSQEVNAIFDLSSDGILLCDGDGKIIQINDASERLNGWTVQEVVGRNVRDLVDDHLIDKSVTLKVFETRKQVNMMQYISRTQKHLLVTGTPLFDKKGEIRLVVVNERDLTQLNIIKEKLEETQKVTEKYRDELIELAVLESRTGGIIAESREMKQVLKYAVKLARLDASNILLLGESGTGKGLLTKFIHDHGKRRGKPLIQINCAALPEGLLEAELFGYEKGAYTGASETGKAGLFELAQEGTLFLDEIGDCPISIQAKLLKYLDDHEVLRLGSVEPKIIDCNIIAATNRNLEDLIKKGSFRSDLFYRLNTFTIRIPPIRERPEDTFELIILFLDEFNSRYGLKRKISSSALQRLQNYQYPGNVRELKNIIKQAVVMSENDILDKYIISGLGDHLNQPNPEADRPEGNLGLKEQVCRFEKGVIKEALACCRSTREMAALLGTSQPTVLRRLRTHGLPLPSNHS